MKKHILLIIILIIVSPIFVRAESCFLYDVLKNESETSNLAREYTEEHQDSFDPSLSTQKIYHYYASNNTETNQIKEKNNVIFGDICWQMIRTTDTGGVKLLFNGRAENNKCLTNRPNYLGYNNSMVYSITGSKFFASNYRYDEETSKFYLTGDIFQTAVNDTTGPSIVGKYTCLSTNDGPCPYIAYVERISGFNNAYLSLLKTNNAKTDLGSTYYNENLVVNGPSAVGYMYNEIPSLHSRKSNKTEISTYRTYTTGTVYWVADSVTYNTSNRTYSLKNPYQVTFNNDESFLNSISGKYTLFDTSKNASSTYAYYIVEGDGNNGIYYLTVMNNQALEEVDYYATYGSSIIDNNDGTFTIENPTTVRMVYYKKNYNYLNKKYVCLSAINNTCNNPIYIGATNANYYNYLPVYDAPVFGNDFIYQNGQYTLTSNRVSIFNYLDTNNVEPISTHHYTCWNSTGVCNKLYYVYYQKGNSFNDIEIFYIEIKDGEKIEQYIQRMLSANDLNLTNSSIKVKVDDWFEKNLLNYTNYIEDTIYCNDRSIKDLGGWNPNGGSIHNTLFFNLDMKCQNITDQFSTNNNKAKLKYPVGLVTYKEMQLVNKYNKNLGNIWTMTPFSVNYEVNMGLISYSAGMASTPIMAASNKIVPMISLKPKIRYISGNGSKDSPYIIDYNNYYSIDVIAQKEKYEFTSSIEDLTNVQEGETVIFSVIPIEGYEINNIQIIDSNYNNISFSPTNNMYEYTFNMPGSNVSIIPHYQKVSNAVEVEYNEHTKEIIIEVNDVTSVEYEEIVKFKVIPEEGYKVDKIIITDENNNTIEYSKTDIENEYEFIMPITSTLIKPYFKDILINPKTGNYSLIAILFVFIISIISYILVYRKKSYIVK